MNRYGSFFIVLHWLSASMILVQLSIGSLIPLSLHVVAGVLIGLLMIKRLVMKFQSIHQSPETEKTTTSKLAVITHSIIYGLVFAIIISGTGLLVARDNVSETILSLHNGLIDLLFVIVGLHVIAALFHQFVLKDRLLSKMWINKTLDCDEHLRIGSKLDAALPNR